MQDIFAPAVEDAVRAYEARFGEDLCAIYLAGSMAFDEGLAGISDMDIFAFVDYEPGPSDLQWRMQSEEELGKQYPQVEHFNLNINSCDHLVKHTIWRFILRYNSVRIRGRDIVTETEQHGEPTPVPSKELAKDHFVWVSKYFQRAREGQIPKELYTPPADPYLATRKLARNFVILAGAHVLMADGAFVSFRQEDVLCQLRRCHPQWEQLYTLTEATQRDPIGAGITPDGFMPHLAPFMEWAIAHIEAA